MQLNNGMWCNGANYIITNIILAIKYCRASWLDSPLELPPGGSFAKAKRRGTRLALRQLRHTCTN